MSVPAENFIQIDKPITQAVKRCSLFNLIRILLAEKSVLIKSDNILKVKNEEREAYLIPLEEAPAINLYHQEGFQYRESHLSIDKVYSLETSEKEKRFGGFAYVHYTESYKHPETFEKIVVHVYFNSQGQYLYCQVKKLETFLKVDDVLENQIKNNSVAAAEMLSILLEEKARRYLKAVAEAEELEKALSQCLFSGDETQYIQIAGNFKKEITKINYYNDLTLDRRAEIVDKVVQDLQRKKAELIEQRPTVIIPEVAVPEEKVSLPQKTKIKTKTDRHAMKVLTFTDIGSIASQLDKTLNVETLESRIEAYKVAKKLQDKLFDLMSFELTKQDRSIVSKVETKINKALIAEELLKQCASEGNVEKFKEVCILVETVKASYVKDLLNSMINNENEKLLEAQIAMCEFLFVTSATYGAFILGNKILVEILQTEELNFGVSLLLKAVIQDNWPVFSMLLRHGYNPNGGGLVYNKKFGSLLRSCIYFAKDKKYIESLLAYGALSNRLIGMIPENINNIGAIKNFSRKHISQAKENTAHMSTLLTPSKSGASLDKIFDLSIPDLLLAYEYEQHSFFACLKEKGSLKDIAIVVSALALSKSFMSRFSFGVGRGGVFCAANVEEANSMTIVDEEFKNRSLFIIYPAIELNEENKGLFGKYEALKLLHKSFEDRCQANLQEIDTSISLLEELVEKTANRIHKAYYYNACLFLMTQKQNPTAKDVGTIMQINCKFGALYYKDDNEVLKTVWGFLMFRRAIDIARQSSFPMLKETKIFKFACEKLENTPYAYEPNESMPLLFSNMTIEEDDAEQTDELEYEEAPSSSAKKNEM